MHEHATGGSRTAYAGLGLVAFLTVLLLIGLGLWGTRWTVPAALPRGAAYSLAGVWDGEDSPDGPLQQPIGIAVSPNGDVYVTDATRYLLLVVAVAVVATAGCVGYVLYPRFDLPAQEGAGLLALAAAAGFASFFSPCSFPLLLGLLGRQAVAQMTRGERAHPTLFGGALALGAGIFLLLAGIVIALGGQALFAGVTFDSPAGITIRSVVGGLLVLLGLIQTGIRPFSLHAVSELARPLARWQARLRRQRPAAGFAVFGFGYVLAGFG